MLGIATYAAILTHTLYSLYRNPTRYFHRLRAITKISLLAVTNLSPIYIFCIALFIDLLLIAIEYYLSMKSCGRMWVLKNVMLDLALAALALVPSALLTLIIASVLVVGVLVLDLVTHAGEIKNRKRTNFFRAKENTEMGRTVQEINIWDMEANNRDKMYSYKNNEMREYEEKKISGSSNNSLNNLNEIASAVLDSPEIKVKPNNRNERRFRPSATTKGNSGSRWQDSGPEIVDPKKQGKMA